MFFEIHWEVSDAKKNTEGGHSDGYNREMENETFRLPVSRAATEPLDDPHFNPVRNFVLNDADILITRLNT